MNIQEIVLKKGKEIRMEEGLEDMSDHPIRLDCREILYLKCIVFKRFI